MFLYRNQRRCQDEEERLCRRLDTCAWAARFFSPSFQVIPPPPPPPPGPPPWTSDLMLHWPGDGRVHKPRGLLVSDIPCEVCCPSSPVPSPFPDLPDYLDLSPSRQQHPPPKLTGRRLPATRRGDGRIYIANLRTDNWLTGGNSDDVWQAPLFTRCVAWTPLHAAEPRTASMEPRPADVEPHGAVLRSVPPGKGRSGRRSRSQLRRSS